MEFEHNAERDAYIGARGKVVLNACPGSGKTTTIAFKLCELIKDWELPQGKYFGIACLSFTNVAKDEINSKFANFCGDAVRFPHIVSTIDSFINQYITLPFYYLFRKDFLGRPMIVDNAGFMDKWSFRFCQTVQKNNGSTFSRPIHLAYVPSKIDINLDGGYLFDGKSSSLTATDLASFNKYCTALKELQFSKGLLKNSDSTYVALKILQENPNVAKMLARRFPYVIIDEAQDTSEIQYAVIDILIRNGLESIELVGDPYQSLYEWREARPDMFTQRYDSAEWSSLKLNKCRRSTQTIVDCYCALRRDCDFDLESNHEVAVPEPIRVLHYSSVERLIEKYRELSGQYEKRKVLVRGGMHLEALGAKVKHDIMWKLEPCVPYDLMLAQEEMDDGYIRECVQRIRRCLPVLVDPARDVKGQKDWLEEEGKKPEWNARIMELVSKLPSFELSLAEWTQQTQKLCKDVLKLTNDPDFGLKKGNKSPLHAKQMKGLYKCAPNSESVCTIHAAKGKTFDSVMLVLSKDSTGQNISLGNFERPVEFPDEKKRMIYVAISRPREQLVIAIPKDAGLTEEQIRERLGEAVEIEVIE